MKIYQVAHRKADWEHTGFSYHTNKRAAEKTLKKENPYPDNDPVKELEVTLTKDGLMKALEVFASHPDNG